MYPCRLLTQYRVRLLLLGKLLLQGRDPGCILARSRAQCRGGLLFLEKLSCICRKDTHGTHLFCSGCILKFLVGVFDIVEFVLQTCVIRSGCIFDKSIVPVLPFIRGRLWLSSALSSLVPTPQPSSIPCLLCYIAQLGYSVVFIFDGVKYFF